ncbi:DHHW family protein [Ruminococcus sp.]|uniref:DHHW family protein n=1 Tax=Ruminococcus sp. TaxID=41978 RepID=UPI00388D9DC5
MKQSENPSNAPQRKRSGRYIHLTLCLLLAAVTALSCAGCRQSVDQAKATEAVEVAATVAAPTEPPYDPLNFVKPNIPDSGAEGAYSAVDSGVYVYDNMTFELCGASDSAAEDYAAAISDFKKSAPEFTVYNIVATTHAEFGLPQRLIDSGSVYSASQLDNIKKIYSSYSQDVKPINCYNTLGEHINEYIYFNTDHHWTGLGAYYAYQAFCEQTNQTPLKLTDCTENKKEGFLGSFSDCADSLKPDTVYYWTFPYATHAMRQEESGMEPYEMNVYYEHIENPSGLYSTFICGDSSLFIEYNDDNKNGKKIAVVKESYGNAFVPYLTYNYEEVHVIDSRYFVGSLKDYMKENGITEILFINNIMSANNPFMVDGIRGIF